MNFLDYYEERKRDDPKEDLERRVRGGDTNRLLRPFAEIAGLYNIYVFTKSESVPAPIPGKTPVPKTSPYTKDDIIHVRIGGANNATTTTTGSSSEMPKKKEEDDEDEDDDDDDDDDDSDD
eukprot:TRINITY_DN2017_c2_g2_i4.p1 TRINITY_DN2017_c2_g2~~TRINITY_DN2017_c2_g2_i4.p1  ORF type:complete len:121 (+),score=48.65 TRINITY_DN2017_c2_g2_i4:122-484(+)